MTVLEKTVHQFGYNDIEDFAKDQAKLLVLSKIEEYQNKITYFEKKYSIKFKEFEKQLSLMKNDGDFEKEDDYME